MNRLRLSIGDDTEPPALSRELHELLSPGLVDRDGALLLRTADAANRHLDAEFFPDLTGYEAFVNHFHVDAAADGLDDLRIAFVAANEIRRQIRVTDRPELPVRLIISRNLSGPPLSSTVRFHRLRPGEMWLSEDLDGYEDEAVGFLDVDPTH